MSDVNPQTVITLLRQHLADTQWQLVLTQAELIEARTAVAEAAKDAANGTDETG